MDVVEIGERAKRTGTYLVGISGKFQKELHTQFISVGMNVDRASKEIVSDGIEGDDAAGPMIMAVLNAMSDGLASVTESTPKLTPRPILQVLDDGLVLWSNRTRAIGVEEGITYV